LDVIFVLFILVNCLSAVDQHVAYILCRNLFDSTW